MINSVYFGEQGLTSTSANHIANIAKELCQDLELQLLNVNFYTTTINLIGDSKVSILNNGTKELDWIPEAIDKIAKVNSLIAWLREAIKAREKAIKEIEELSVEQYAVLKGIEFPERPYNKESLTEEEYYDSLPIKERNRYYSLEAQASTLGKYIHLNGSLNKARKQLSNKFEHPHQLSGSGRDAIIYNYNPTVSVEEVDNLFFELQNKHREIQSQLNAIKYECEKAVKESRIKTNQEYQTKFREYVTKCDDIRAEMKIFIEEQTKRIGNLKIIIPDKLKDIYNEVSQLGK